MARAHLRFVVRDQYGYALQNCRVNVYQPGTSTAFTGTAYNARTGGTSVANPFTTNAQGEIEAWLDDPQQVDVQVDDNTDTAYRAVDGASATLSFTTFTEGLNVIPDADDIALAATVTALPSNSAPLGRKTTATGGDDAELSRDDHQHPFDAAVGKTTKQTKTTTAEEVLHTLAVGAGVLTAGSMYRIALKGYQTNGTTACTYTFRVRWGGVAGVLVGQALAIVGTTTAHTDNPVSLDFLMTAQSIGATGTATGSWSGQECISTATANTPKLVLDVQNAAATIDTTVAKDLVVTLELSTTTGTPNFELDNVLIEQVA